MSKVKHLVALLAALCVVLLSQRAEATHFRYGNITYSIPDPAHPLTVRFEVTSAWRAAFVGTSTLNFGDGLSNPDTEGVEVGSGFDASGLEYKFQKYVVSHTYAAVGQYTAFFTSCCRLSNLVNAGDDSFRVEAKVDLAPGNKGNPISLVPAIIQLQTGGVRTLFIPATDPDGTPVTCRFSNAVESMITTTPPVAAGTGQIPTLGPSANPPGCQLTWNLNGATPGQQYAVSVQIETINPGNAKINSANIDFIIEFVLAPPPTCNGSGTFVIPMGTSFSHEVFGVNSGGFGAMKMSWLGSNGQVSPLPGNVASPYKVTLNWSPGLGEEGTYNSTIVFTDNHSESGFCSLTLIVPPCPEFGQACSTGVGECAKNGIQQCLNGNVVCSAVAGQPQPEICDGLDNNCDGAVDEGDPGAGLDCMSGLSGLCAPGITTCAVGGVVQCVPDVLPGAVSETCNTVDDNCDGTVDDGFSVGQSCSAGVGGCKVDGAIACDGLGGAACTAVAGSPSAEVCNGVDDDCNGTTDEGFDLGGACSGGTGACAASGVFVCNGVGAVVCDAMVGTAKAEVCGNDVDEDCNGALDNGCVDTDSDGLFDPTEVALGLDPKDADSDDDGVPDGDEPDLALDTDGDGLINALDPDSDNDGLLDGTELGLGCDDPAIDKEKHSCRADVDPATKTDPLAYDTDKGGVSDGSEDANLDGKVDAGELDPLAPGDDASNVDTDQDGLSDALELFLGTTLDDIDSDDDGWPDGEEYNPTCDTDGDGLINLLDVDSDDDALPDGLEVGNNCLGAGVNQAKGHCRPDANHGATKTNPLLRDTDGGGSRDGSEDANLDGIVDPNESDPGKKADDKKLADADKDGLSDKLETFLLADPNDADSDDDGLLDGDERNPGDDHDGDGKINLLDADSDGDALFDGTEAGNACDDPDTAASASACIADADQGQTTTGVLQADTDKGGVKDGTEDENHDGKVDAPFDRDPNLASDDMDMLPDCQGADDTRCGGPTSGKVCDAATSKCVPGCRGTGGNGCPTGKVCSSTDATIGTCGDPSSGTGGAGGGGGDATSGTGGCSCELVTTSPEDWDGVLLLGGLVLAGARRRRRAA